MTLRITNVQSGAATLQTSTDAASWQDLKTFALAPGVIAQVQLAISTADKARFFRIKE